MIHHNICWCCSTSFSKIGSAYEGSLQKQPLDDVQGVGELSQKLQLVIASGVVIQHLGHYIGSVLLDNCDKQS